MKSLLTGNLQENMVRKYFEAFVANDVDGMMADMHPAVHYLRSVNGKLMTVVNGARNFLDYMKRHAVRMNERTLAIVPVKNEPDIVEVRFTIDTNPEKDQPEEHLTGRAVFWFMEGMILQLVVQVETM